MKRQLTDTKVKNAKTSNTAYKLTDGGGLYLYITPQGTKSWRFNFKFQGKYKTIVIGQYPHLSLSKARELHDEARDKIKDGIDPSAKIVSAADQPFSYYAKEMLRRQDLSESTINKKILRMKKYLFPILDQIPITKITSIDILNIVQPISDNGARETAIRLAAYSRQVFDTLLSMQLITNNPAESIARLLPKPKNTKNFSHTTDRLVFSRLLNAIDNYKGDAAVFYALKLMPFVFLRPKNIRLMRWDMINFDEKIILIPAADMKMRREHKVPISNQALDIILALKSLKTDSPYLFSTARGAGSPMSENTLTRAISCLVDPLTGLPFGKGVMTAHGFRHTASTFLNEMRFHTDVIELQLAHVDKDRIRAVYNKAELLDERREMMQRWADEIDNLKQLSIFDTAKDKR